MFLLATLLTFGWPKERTVFLPAPDHTLVIKNGLTELRLATCCGSMRPTIQGGELAYGVPYTGQPLVGHIVTTNRFTHRVLDENSRAIYTAGDFNRRSDGWSSKKDIRFVIGYIVRK